MTNRHRLGTTLALTLASVAVTGCVSSAPPKAGAPHPTPSAAAAATVNASPVPTPGALDGRDRPNIFMITVDDAAPADLRYMPQVKKMITDQGVELTTAIAPTPICVPARASLLTGQYTHNHGALTIDGRGGGFDAFDDRNTLPVWLNDAGYDTFFVGKYLNGYGQGRGAEHYVPPGWTSWNGSLDPHTYDFSKVALNRDGRVVKQNRYNSDAFASRVTGILGSKARKTDPWYMWVNYVAPHFGGPRESDDPLVTHPRHKQQVRTTSPAKRHRDTFDHLRLPRTPDMFEDGRDKVVKPARKNLWDKLSKRMLRESYQQRIESLQAVDEAVGKHLRLLKRTGQLEETLVVFSSDNGYMTGEHNLNGKLWHYDNSLTLPMVMRGPGIPKGRTVHTAVTNVDLPVTFAAAAGVAPGRAVDGENVLPYLNRPDEVTRVIPIEAYPVGGGTRREYSGIRVGDDYTYVNLRGKEELYDRDKDPYELHNVAKDPRYADTIADLRSLDATYRDCAAQTCPTGAHDN